MTIIKKNRLPELKKQIIMAMKLWGVPAIYVFILSQIVHSQSIFQE